MFMLVGRLIALSIGAKRIAVAQRTLAVGGGLTAVGVGADVTLDWLRQRALELAPGSDAAALEEAARSAYRMLGLDNDEVLWPTSSNGEPITPRYFVMDINRGRAWFSKRYYSRKSVSAGFRRGSRYKTPRRYRYS